MVSIGNEPATLTDVTPGMTRNAAPTSSRRLAGHGFPREAMCEATIRFCGCPIPSG